MTSFIIVKLSNLHILLNITGYQSCKFQLSRMSGSSLTWGGVKNTPPSAAPGGKSPVLLGLKASLSVFQILTQFVPRLEIVGNKQLHLEAGSLKINIKSALKSSVENPTTHRKAQTHLPPPPPSSKMHLRNTPTHGKAFLLSLSGYLVEQP